MKGQQMLGHGAYSLIDLRLPSANLAVAVEGLRPDWARHIEDNFEILKSREAQQGFLLALTVVENQFQPEAYQRSLPVARFQAQFSQMMVRLRKKPLHEAPGKQRFRNRIKAQPETTKDYADLH
jgi:hypothetical protein